MGPSGACAAKEGWAGEAGRHVQLCPLAGWLPTTTCTHAPRACSAIASRSAAAASRAARSARSYCCCVRAHCMSCSARCLAAAASALRAAMASQAARQSARSAPLRASRPAASWANHSCGVTPSKKALKLRGARGRVVGWRRAAAGAVGGHQAGSAQRQAGVVCSHQHP